MAGRTGVRVALVGVCLTVGLAGLVTVSSSVTAAVGPCARAAGGDGPFYPGPSASTVYNSTFAQGPAIPHLSTHIPQGLTTWRNWKGSGSDLLLVGAYRDGSRSYLIGINPASGKRVGTVQVAESHLGALGLAGKWLFTTGSDNDRVRKYKVSDLRDAMKRAAANNTKPVLAEVGKAQKVIGSHFMTVDDGEVWAGRYSRSSDNSAMARYRVRSDGTLDQAGKPWPVPTQTQGALVTEDRFVFYSGLTTGKVTVIERSGRDLSGATGRCFAAPNFGQNLAQVGDRVFLNFEGGSAKDNVPNTANKIKHLHVADLDELGALTNP
ncbi:MAG: hypothetical protein ACT4P1_03665 [Sporichthyaceae bacterium]